MKDNPITSTWVHAAKTEYFYMLIFIRMQLPTCHSPSKLISMQFSGPEKAGDPVVFDELSSCGGNKVETSGTENCYLCRRLNCFFFRWGSSRCGWDKLKTQFSSWFAGVSFSALEGHSISSEMLLIEWIMVVWNELRKNKLKMACLPSTYQ